MRTLMLVVMMLVAVLACSCKGKQEAPTAAVGGPEDAAVVEAVAAPENVPEKPDAAAEPAPADATAPTAPADAVAAPAEAAPTPVDVPPAG